MLPLKTGQYFKDAEVYTQPGNKANIFPQNPKNPNITPKNRQKSAHQVHMIDLKLHFPKNRLLSGQFH